MKMYMTIEEVAQSLRVAAAGRSVCSGDQGWAESALG
jgi:hypothetical protein